MNKHRILVCLLCVAVNAIPVYGVEEPVVPENVVAVQEEAVTFTCPYALQWIVDLLEPISPYIP